MAGQMGNLSAGDWMRIGGMAANVAGLPGAGSALGAGAGTADIYGMAQQDKAYQEALKRQQNPYVINPEQQAKDVELVKNYPSAEARQKQREGIITRTGQITSAEAERQGKKREAQRSKGFAPLSIPQGGPVTAGGGGSILRPQPGQQQQQQPLTLLAQLLTRRMNFGPQFGPTDVGGGF